MFRFLETMPSLSNARLAACRARPQVEELEARALLAVVTGPAVALALVGGPNATPGTLANTPIVQPLPNLSVQATNPVQGPSFTAPLTVGGSPVSGAPPTILSGLTLISGLELISPLLRFQNPHDSGGGDSPDVNLAPPPLPLFGMVMADGSANGVEDLRQNENAVSPKDTRILNSLVVNGTVADWSVAIDGFFTHATKGAGARR